MAVDSSESYLGLELAGRYQLSEVLAYGALCTVYRGKDLMLRRPVAVKVISPDLCETYRASLAATTSLMHPATIALYDAIEQDEWLFLVQEYVAASALDSYFKRGVPTARAVDIGMQLAKALDHVHRREMVHGDLTPSAVMVDRHAMVRINNFGLPPDTAYFARMRTMLPPAEDTEATAIITTDESGVTLVRSDESPVGPQAEDVRAVGYLLWQMLSEPRGLDSTGRRDLRPDVPASVASLLRCCCAVPGEQPLTSATELLLALEDVSAQLAQERPAASTVTPPALRSARVAVEEAAAWAMEETLANNQIWASSLPGKAKSTPTGAQVTADTPSGDLAVTRPSLDAGGIVRPGLRLPTRSYSDDTFPPLPSERDTRPDAEWPVRLPTREQRSERGGIGLGAVLLLGVLLFVIFFLIGYLLPFTFGSGR